MSDYRAEAITAAAEVMPGLTREHAIQVATEAVDAAAPHLAAAERERLAQFIEHEANRDSGTPAAAWSWLAVYLRQEGEDT